MPTLAPFEIHRTTTVSEAADLIAELGDAAAVYSGGTELLLLMKLGLLLAKHLYRGPLGFESRFKLCDTLLELKGIGQIPEGWTAIRVREATTDVLDRTHFGMCSDCAKYLEDESP